MKHSEDWRTMTCCECGDRFRSYFPNIGRTIVERVESTCNGCLNAASVDFDGYMLRLCGGLQIHTAR